MAYQPKFVPMLLHLFIQQCIQGFGRPLVQFLPEEKL